jgi:hypothetical protein
LIFQGAIEPMQVDAAPEENENVEEEQYSVENVTMVIIEKYSDSTYN